MGWVLPIQPLGQSGGVPMRRMGRENEPEGLGTSRRESHTSGSKRCSDEIGGRSGDEESFRNSPFACGTELAVSGGLVVYG